MFCQSCGQKVINVGKFCEHCGGETGIPIEGKQTSSVVIEQQSTPSQAASGGFQVQLNKLTKKQKLVGLALVMSVILIFGAFQLFQYLNSPEKVANQYVKALNGKQYEKVTQYYEDFMNQNSLTKAMVVKSMSDMSENSQQPVIRIIEKGKRRDMVLADHGYSEFELLDKNKAYIPVEYDYGNNNKYINVLTLYKSLDGKKWQTTFPYSMGYATVMAPSGTTILVDGVEVLRADSSRYFDVGPYLPGKYTLEMKYINDIQPPYIQEIFLPDESYIESPYDTYRIYVETLTGAEIIFNQESLGTDGYVYIDDVLEGKHNITIKMDGMADIVETEVEVSSGNRNFVFTNLNANSDLTNTVADVIKKYNKALSDAYVNYNEESNEDPLKDLKNYVTNYRYYDEEYYFYDNNSWKKINSQTSEGLAIHDIRIYSKDYIVVYTEEGWHTKEQVHDWYYWHFSVNGERSLERKNYMEGTYELVKDNGVWKIDDVSKYSYENQYLNEYGEWIHY